MELAKMAVTERCQGLGIGKRLLTAAIDQFRKTGWKGERIAQGRDNACRWMIENPKAAEEIRALLVAKRKAENAKLGAPVAEAAAAA